MLKIIFASVLLAFPALAQTEPSDFVRIGQMDVVIDGKPSVFQIGTIREGRESFADISDEEGQAVVGIMGSTLDADRRYNHPSLSFRLPLVGGLPGPFSLISYTEVEHGAPGPILAGAPAGELQLRNFSLSQEGVVEFDFSAKLLRMDNAWEPLSGRPPVEISGRVYVTIPDAFRE